MMHKNFVILFAVLAEAVIGTLTLQPERLEHGTPVNSNEFPFMAAIMKGDNTFHCNAVLITQQFLLTTASCLLIQKSDLPITVVTGTNNFYRGGERHTIKHHAILKGRTYNGKNRNKRQWFYDIGIFMLDKPVEINSQQKPIDLIKIPLTKGTNIKLNTKDLATIVGWGKDKLNKINPDLQKVMIRIQSNFRCKYWWIFDFYDHHLCGERRYKEDDGFCAGNDGSAVIYKGALIGITSHGLGPSCNPGYLITISSVYHLKFFIDARLKEFTSYKV
ncbi:chymotrypsin-1-like [Prorops nasuta]|uniref:chymotrypsin-1-like n=1 Tax=Prorops nasuta TaxID=863751 RepID=UPI0034CE6E8F